VVQRHWLDNTKTYHYTFKVCCAKNATDFFSLTP
jgi:hypothetical protein